VTSPFSTRKGNFFTFLFDHADSIDIRRGGSVEALLEERRFHPLGFHWFLSIVTVMAFATTARSLLGFA
jgi:hypothetical protein